jgi:hypothetical protein
MSKFNLFNGRGVQFTFDNGYTLSVMFGYANYCESENTAHGVESRDAEIAIFGGPVENKRWATRGVCAVMGKDIPWDDVIGRLTVDEVMEFAAFIGSVKPGSDTDRAIQRVPTAYEDIK